MSLAYYRYFVGDHLKAKIGMNHEQKGIYGDLLDISWEQDPPGTLPNDPAEIARLVGVPLKRFTPQVPIVLRAWKRQGKRLVHEWLQREHGEGLAYHNERSETGKKGAEAKRNKKLSLRLAEAELKPPSSSSSPSSSDQGKKLRVDSSNRSDLNEPAQFLNGANQEKMPTPEKMKTHPLPLPAGVTGTVEDLFNHVFWPAYPRKEHKIQARAVFTLLGPGIVLLGEIMAFLESEKKYWDESGQTPPLPDNFLKAQEWKFNNPLPPEAKAKGLIVSDALEPEPREELVGTGAYLNKAGTYPRD